MNTAIESVDLMEYTAEVDYRLCLSELGLTEEDVTPDESGEEGGADE